MLATTRTQAHENRLLALMPAQVRARLAAEITPLQDERRLAILSAHEPITHVYFPRGGMLSVTIALDDGTAVDGLVIGPEGMAGVEALVTARPASIGGSVVQTCGTCVDALPIAALRRELAREYALAGIVGRYLRSMRGRLQQLVACNASHDLEQRCSRWLLTAQDQVGDEIRMGQDALATALGVSRPALRAVVDRLRREGAVVCPTGRIRIRDRTALETVSCECYGVLRDEYLRDLQKPSRGVH